MLSSIIPRCSLDVCMASRACSHACHAWCCSVPLMIVPPSLLSAPRCAQQSSPPASVALPWHSDGFGATGAQNREHRPNMDITPQCTTTPTRGLHCPRHRSWGREVKRANDTELCHPAEQGGALHAQTCRGAVGACHHPVGGAQGSQDMRTHRVVQHL